MNESLNVVIVTKKAGSFLLSFDDCNFDGARQTVAMWLRDPELCFEETDARTALERIDMLECDMLRERAAILEILLKRAS